MKISVFLISPALSTHSRPSGRGNTFFVEGQRKIKLVNGGGSGLRNRFVSAYLAASGAHRKASGQASVIVRLCKVPFRKI